MPIPLRVLIVSDRDGDAAQLIDALRQSDYVPSSERVCTPAALREALAHRWDLILATGEGKRLGTLRALEILRETGADVPLVAISEMASEDSVLEVLKAGAADCIARNQLSRLSVTVSREMTQAEGRRERSRLEQQFRQSQKMEAVGRLAGGVAHDFNNLLTVITGYAELLLAGDGLEPEGRAALEEIQRAAERGGALTHQLLAFSRGHPFTPSVVQLNTLLMHMEKMLSRLIGEDIELITVAAAEPAMVCSDPGQLEQAVMNMVVNARDAMPGGGKLILETANAEVAQTYAGPNMDVKPGSYVVLAISDTGMGMDSETLTHLFEPFYTTKAPGKGTGLGLATAYGIVKQSGGAISVYSEPGRGTTMKIYLPSAEAKAAAQGAEHAPAAAQRGSETILVLEDEARVRKLVCDVLAGRGYHVLEAVRGEEAVRMAAEHKGRIHLLLADVVMPEMSGPQALEQIRARHPHMKVLFMSGYTDEAMVHHGILDSGAPFLQKPFLPETLARKVREVLASQASAG
ncbi:MAG TPA: response regulator [Bryobacteraceae bacterium]|jgi:signal transduction histidine kinase/ActR/RegA family two-component response regulator|nr:response regulator [Bryobacteraceae bacterium]